MRNPPWSPPLVGLADGSVVSLLAWELQADRSWLAWVYWAESAGNPPRYHRRVSAVPAGEVKPLESPDAYRAVPRMAEDANGQIRSWSWSGTLPPRAPPPGVPVGVRTEATMQGPARRSFGDTQFSTVPGDFEYGEWSGPVAPRLPIRGPPVGQLVTAPQ